MTPSPPERPDPRQDQPSAWDWQRDAHCRDVGTDLFFPRENEPRDEVVEQERRAKHYCRRCTVRLRCLQHALTTPERHGVWGGTTPKERSVLARGARSEPSQHPSATARSSTDTPPRHRHRHTAPHRPRPVTGADVARATVSRALAGVQVDDDTRRKVRLPTGVSVEIPTSVSVARSFMIARACGLYPGYTSGATDGPAPESSTAPSHEPRGVSSVVVCEVAERWTAPEVGEVGPTDTHRENSLTCCGKTAAHRIDIEPGILTLPTRGVGRGERIHSRIARRWGSRVGCSEAFGDHVG